MRAHVHDRVNLLYCSAVFLGAALLFTYPGCEFRFLFLLASDYVKLLEGVAHAYPFLPSVGRSGIFVGILEAHLVVGAHLFPEHVLSHGPGRDAYVVDCQHVLKLRGGLVPLGASGVAHHHHEVALIYAVERDAQELAGLEGHVVLRVRSGFVVLSGIYAEHREVAGVAGPHPVVGVSSEFARSCGRRAYEAYVAVDLVDYEILHVVVEEADNLCLAMGVVLLGPGYEVFSGLLVADLSCHVGH